MKRVKIDLCGIVFEYERPPMPEHRFKALCLLSAAGIYGGMVAKVAALCGTVGVAVVGVATFFVVMASMLD